MNALVLGCAYAMDLMVGDPEWFPHPVRAMGRMIAAGEAAAAPGRHAPGRDLVHGAVVTVAVVIVTAAAAVLALRAFWRCARSGWFTQASRSSWKSFSPGPLSRPARWSPKRVESSAQWSVA